MGKSNKNNKEKSHECDCKKKEKKCKCKCECKCKEKCEEPKLVNDIELCFLTPLAECQEIRLLNDSPRDSPRDEDHNEERRDRCRASGQLVLKFSEDLCSVKYKLYVFNAKKGDKKPTVAHLHLGRANRNGPPIVVLYSNEKKNYSHDKDCEDNLLAEGHFNNHDLEFIGSPEDPEVPEVPTIASLLDWIRRGYVYVNVHGSGPYADGLIRGQVFARETS
jgi:hypothetical protein